MAEFNVVGLDGLDKLKSSLQAIANEMSGEAGGAALTAGGELLTKYFVGAIAEEGLVDTGQLVDSIKPTAVRTGKSGRYVDVFPQGKRKDGVRNAHVGFIAEHGVTRAPPKKSQKATHWMSNTVDTVEEEILDAMEAVLLASMDNHLKG